MFVLALVVIGLQSRSRMPEELNPKVDIPYVTVITTYPGAGPTEIETLLSEPIEKAVTSIGNLKDVTSSSQDGVSTVVLEFELGTNLEAVTADVRDKVGAIRQSLPEDADESKILKLDIAAMPVMTIGLTGPLSPKDMRILADDVIVDKLAKVGGVASINVSGGEQREISISADKDRLDAYAIGIDKIVTAIRGANLNVPAGSIKEGARDYSVRTVGEYKSADEIANTRIYLAGSNGKPASSVRIGDVAKVTDTIAEPGSYTRLNGKPSVVFSVQKQSDANTVAVSDGVKEQLKELEDQLPEGVKPVIAIDQSTFVKHSLEDVNKSLMEGILLVVIIVFLFLHSARATFIVAIAIPTSLMATFIPISAFGFTQNNMVLLALSLVVGILVDDSIVVLENIERHLRLREQPDEAALNGRSEIGLAAIAITMVDIVVFLPIAFMGGLVGQFFRQFGITVATATAFSLLMSFTLTPMLASRWMKSEADKERGEDEMEKRLQAGAATPKDKADMFAGRLFDVLERFLRGLDSRYRGILEWALHNRFLTVVIGAVSLLAVFSMPSALPTVPMWLAAGVKMAPRVLIMAILGGYIAAAVILYWRGKAVAGLCMLGIPVGLGALVALFVATGANVLGSLAWTLIFAVVYVLWWSLPIQRRYKIAVQLWGLVVIWGFAVLGVFFAKMAPEVKAVLPRLMMISVALGSGLIAAAVDRQSKRTAIGFGVVMAFVALTIYLPFGFGFFPVVDQGQFQVSVRTAPGTSLVATDRVVRKVEQIIEDIPEIQKNSIQVADRNLLLPWTWFRRHTETQSGYYMSIVGSSSSSVMGSGDSGPQYAVISAKVVDKKFRHRNIEEIAQWVSERAADVPGAEMITVAATSGGGPGNNIQKEVQGQNMDDIITEADRVADVMRKVPGAVDVDVSFKPSRPERRITVDRLRATQLDMTVAQVAIAARTAIDGDDSVKLRDGGTEYPIRVHYAKRDRENVSDIDNLIIATREGAPIYLRDVAKVNYDYAPTKIDRKNRQRVVYVNANLARGAQMGNVNQSIEASLKKSPLVPGTSVGSGGSTKMMMESFGYMGSALLLAVLLVYMLMGALFESFLTPFVIMFSLPQAMVGALLALLITGNSMTIVAMIGIIMLMGLVTKNAILLVDYTNTLRSRGKARHEALLEAGPTRLRPILMTTLAIIGGMMPTALALNEGAEQRAPMAITVIGGLILSTLLTLIVIPVTYTFVDDLWHGILRRFAPKAKCASDEESVQALAMGPYPGGSDREE